MKRNESAVDRIVRVVAGIVVIAAAFYYGIWWVGVIGGILLITGAIGWCGIYAIFGMSTNKK